MLCIGHIIPLIPRCPAHRPQMPVLCYIVRRPNIPEERDSIIATHHKKKFPLRKWAFKRTITDICTRDRRFPLRNQRFFFSHPHTPHTKPRDRTCTYRTNDPTLHNWGTWQNRSRPRRARTKARHPLKVWPRYTLLVIALIVRKNLLLLQSSRRTPRSALPPSPPLLPLPRTKRKPRTLMVTMNRIGGRRKSIKR